MSDYQQDLTDSARDFMRVIAPEMRRIFGGEFVPVECIKGTPVTNALDLNAGIDVLHTLNGRTRGVSSRIQWIDTTRYQRPYDSFTIRYLRDTQTVTEFAKRVDALQSDDGWLYPHLTMHAYVAEPKGEGQLLSMGIIRTADLIWTCKWIEEHTDGEEVGYGIRRTDNASFFYADWQWLKDTRHIKVHIIRNGHKA